MEANHNEIIERARKQFEAHGATWDDRAEAAIRNVVTPLLLDRDSAILSPAHVRVIRALVIGAIADNERALRLSCALEGTASEASGKLTEAFTEILDRLAGYYGTDGTPY